MTTETVTLFLALLAVAAQAGVLGVTLVSVGGRAAGLARARHVVVDPVRDRALLLAAGVAAVATVGSLYLSEGAHFPPCELCWYQRIAMYPLAPILGLAAWRRDPGVRLYALPLAAVGGLISAYHMAIERFPSLGSGACDPVNPCSIIWVRRFGYLTIPTMALSAFALIAVLLVVAVRPSAGDGEGTRDHEET